MPLTAVPTLHFDSRALPAGQGLAAFNAGAPYYEMTVPPDAAGEFRARVDASFLGDLSLKRCRLSPLVIARTEALIRADDFDAYAFVVLSRGSWSVRTAAGLTMVGPGQLVALDLSHPFEVEVEACDSVNLVVGRATLRSAVRSEFEIAGHVFSGTGGALLTDYLLSLAQHVEAVGPEALDAIRAATIAQIASAVSLVPAPEPLDLAARTVRGTVQRYVERHLTDPDLSAERITAALGVSRSSLYRHFGAYGGIAAFVQRRRLQAVHALLLHPEEERSIGELAETFGFPRPSHFATAFRRAFGCTPRFLRSSSRRPVSVRSTREAVEAPAVFLDWVREINRH